MTATPRAALAIVLLCSLAAACGRTAEEHFARADAYAAQGKHAEAVVEFRRALQENGQYGEAYYRLAQSSEQIQDYANAAKNYILAGQLLVDNVDAQVQSASMLLLGRRFDEALLCAERALHLAPSHVRAQILHAHALSGLKRTGQALASIQRAIALDPTRGETYADFGIFQFVTGSLEQGEENLKKAAESNRPSAAAQMTLASLYWAQGRIDDAEHYLKRAVEIDPDDVRASRALATFYLGINRTEEAEQHLEAIAERSKTTNSRLALADYYIVLDREPEAVRILTVVAAEKDGYAEARSRLAALRYSANDRVAAHALIDETLAQRAGQLPRAADQGHIPARRAKARRGAGPPQGRGRGRSAIGSRALRPGHVLRRQAGRERGERGVQPGPGDRSGVGPGQDGAGAAQPRHRQRRARFPVRGAGRRRAAQPRCLLLLARTLVARGAISRAETVLRPFVDSTTRADLLSLAGAVYVGIGESDRGRELLEQAARLNPDDVEPIENLVAMDLTAGNVARARALADERLSRQPKDVRLLMLAARTYGAGGDTDRMIATLRLAIQDRRREHRRPRPARAGLRRPGQAERGAGRVRARRRTRSPVGDGADDGRLPAGEPRAEGRTPSKAIGGCSSSTAAPRSPPTTSPGWCSSAAATSTRRCNWRRWQRRRCRKRPTSTTRWRGSTIAATCRTWRCRRCAWRWSATRTTRRITITPG